MTDLQIFLLLIAFTFGFEANAILTHMVPPRLHTRVVNGAVLILVLAELIFAFQTLGGFAK